MNKRILYALISPLLFLWPGLIQAQPVNTNLSNTITFDGEPYVAVNPANNQNIVAAWMGERLSGGTYKVSVITRASFDGGNTWSTAQEIPHAQSGFTSADVSLAFDKNGLLYLCFIDYDETTLSGGDYVTRSFNGGQSWDTASIAVSYSESPSKAPLDRPWLVIDKSNTANGGTLYLTSKPAYWIPPPNRNYYTVSTDSGHTWTAIAYVDGGNYLVGNIIQQPMAAPATTKNGNFCAVYPSYLSSQNIYPAYYLATSKDKGQTFSYSTVITAAFTGIDTNLKTGYRLVANPVDSTQLAFFEIDSSMGDPDVMAMHSNDGGQTWSSRVRVNDDPVGNGKDQDMVWANYNEQGNLLATWRDRRNADTTGFWGAGYDFYYAISTDNGQTFTANKILTSQFVEFDSLIDLKGNDFMSCSYVADTIYTVWGDTRSGKMNIYFTKLIASSDTTLAITVLEGDAENFNVFPNPSANVLNVMVSEQLLGTEIAVYDVKGAKIYGGQIRAACFHIPIATWAPGPYFIRAGGDVKKVVKQ